MDTPRRVDTPRRHAEGRAPVRDENRENEADVARRAVQLALDRRDNGGSA
ncbi:MAG: hypothetical protein J2P24_06035 [Streptosporangiales bacterium]|nr:hypothetical protein [Streptosporangiales bacterium]MBO0890987.1 hypothetical protein [Acidothermales bacterium]